MNKDRNKPLKKPIGTSSTATQRLRQYK